MDHIAVKRQYIVPEISLPLTFLPTTPQNGGVSNKRKANPIKSPSNEDEQSAQSILDEMLQKANLEDSKSNGAVNSNSFEHYVNKTTSALMDFLEKAKKSKEEEIEEKKMWEKLVRNIMYIFFISF